VAAYSLVSNAEIKNVGNWFRGTWGRQYEMYMNGKSQSWTSKPLSDIELVVKSKNFVLYP
jgi:hypothetical protein